MSTSLPRKGVLVLCLLTSITFFLSFSTALGQPPEWKKGQIRKIQQRLIAARGLYLGLEPYDSWPVLKRQAEGNKLAEWYRENEQLLRSEPILSRIFKFYLAGRDFIPQSMEHICELLAEGQAEYQSISALSGRDQYRKEFLDRQFSIDDTTFPALYETWFPKGNGIEPGIPCAPPQDRDGDGVLDSEDRCPVHPGLPDYYGCPCPDRDEDGICDDDDDCVDEPGVAEYAGCPCPDRDGDKVCDDNDRCPDTPGAPDRADGCPYSYSIETPKGGRIDIYADTAVYYLSDGRRAKEAFRNSGELLLQLVVRGEFDTQELLLNQAPPGIRLSEEFSGSDYVLIRLSLIDSLSKQTIFFPTGEYAIAAETYPGFYSDFAKAFRGVLKCLEVLRQDFGMTEREFVVLGQGMADKPTFPCRTIELANQHRAFTNTGFYRFNALNNQFERSTWRLQRRCYDNDDLPFLRGAWLIQKLKERIEIQPYQDIFLVLEGIVTPYTNPEERNGTIYIAIDRRKLRQRAEDLQRRIGQGLIDDQHSVSPIKKD